jgi:hypothetical protein
VKLKKEDKKQQAKRIEEKKPEVPTAATTSSQHKKESDKFDLITIVETKDKEIPELAPPFDQILYDFIPESEQRVTASKNDHASNIDE